ncbi:MAG: cytidine deaminase [Lachnospiraceae bacterium]|nr:cytidine deaminase [Lachnospiraceae bacterium]
MIDAQTAKQLVLAAKEARKNAYAPYSRYFVGAAVLTADGRIFGGCNVENASYGASNCAERTAVFKAVSEGVTRIRAIAVMGGPSSCTDEMPDEATPCGICRQVLREFSDPAACDVIIAKSLTNYRITSLGQLLPESFGPENLQY